MKPSHRERATFGWRGAVAAGTRTNRGRPLAGSSDGVARAPLRGPRSAMVGDRALSSATDQHGGAPSGVPTASERSFGTRGDADAVRPSGRIVSQAAILSDARKGGSAGGKEARRPSGCKRSGPASGGLRVVMSIDCSQSQTSREYLPSSSLSGGGTRGGMDPQRAMGINHVQRGNAWQARNVSIQKPMGASSRVRRKRRTRATDSPVEESPEVGDTHGDCGNTVDDARFKRRERHAVR